MDVPTPLTRPPQWLDLSEMIFGTKLGEGCSRTVYSYAPDPDAYVIKVAQSNPSDNFAEAAVWAAVEDYPAAAVWFAPVQYLSKGGNLLVQRRTTPILPAQVPRRIPAFLDDPHSDNWGMLAGRPVVHDYAYHHLFALGARSTRTRVNPAYSFALRVLHEQRKKTGVKNLTLDDINWP